MPRSPATGKLLGSRHLLGNETVSVAGDGRGIPSGPVHPLLDVRAAP